MTAGLPPDFRLLNDGPGRWVCVNENRDEEFAAVWPTPEAACRSAWDWWHDVKGVPDG
jgi:hypothetical protein